MTAAPFLVRDRAAPWLAWAALLVFALLVLLPGLASLPVTDRDEARFVQASRQMVQSGDPIDIRFQDEARHKKPVGIYWLQSAAVLVSGLGDQAPLWVYRLPSLAGAMIAVLLVAVAGTPLVGRSAALLAAAVFAAGLVIGGEARIAKTDAALLACILLAQSALVRLWMQPQMPRGWVWAFWLAMAAAVLIKGPIGPMVPALTAGALVLTARRAAWLRPLAAPGPILLALAAALPWFVAISLRSDGAFWQASVGADLLAKVAAGQEGKGAPPGTYLVALFPAFWPATPLLLLAAPCIWAARREAATAFLLAWAIPVWLFYEAVPTKLFHYTLPVYPALAILATGHLAGGLAAAPRGLRLLAVLAMLPGPALAAVLLVRAAGTGDGEAGAVALLGAGLAGSLAALGLALRALARRATVPLVLACAAAGALLHASLFPALARMPELWPTEGAMAIARDLAAEQECAAPRITSWGYGEPSLVWTGGRETRLLPAEAPATAVVASGPCAVVLRRIGAEAPPAPAGCRDAGRVEGLAIGAGRRVSLQVLDCRGAP